MIRTSFTEFRGTAADNIVVVYDAGVVLIKETQADFVSFT